MRLTAAGNVGIGTSSPAAGQKFEVNGAAKVDGVLTSHSTMRCAAGGDITMGSFTAGTPP
jgi:hypothetical protein